MENENQSIVRTPTMAKYLLDDSQFFYLPLLQKQLQTLLTPPARSKPAFPRVDGLYLIYSDLYRTSWAAKIIFKPGGVAHIEVETIYFNFWEGRASA